MIATRSLVRPALAALAIAVIAALSLIACPSAPPTMEWQSPGGDRALPDWVKLEEFNVVEENGQSRTTITVSAGGTATIDLGYAIRYVNTNDALMPIYAADPNTPDTWPQTITLEPGEQVTLRATSAPPTERAHDVGGVRVQFWNARTGEYIGGASRDW